VAYTGIVTGSAFAEKVADVVGLYLAPPGGAVVLSIDEKTQMRAYLGANDLASGFPQVERLRTRP
jgi:hypothetical protein